MPSKYSSGKNAISECDRCGFRYKLKELRRLIIKTKNVNILVCGNCWEPDQPQLSLGLYPVSDPQAVRNPRPDLSYYAAGSTGLQIEELTSPTPAQLADPLANGIQSIGSRITQWGWGPVGLNNVLNLPNVNNDLISVGAVGTVTIVVT
jgi:hypothetical protein